MARIPKALQPHINAAFPQHVCLVGSVLPDGYAQISPRGSVYVYDDEHLMLWERGRGSTTDNLKDGTRLTIYFQNYEVRDLLPAGGIARFYGVAEVHREGPTYDAVWDKLIAPEKERDPEKKGYAVLVKIERAEDLVGRPLADS